MHGLSENINTCTTAGNDHIHGSQVKYKQLKRRRQGTRTNGRNKCVSTLKALHDELYMITDRNVSLSLDSMITKASKYARQNRPAENKLPFKDKTLSPSKKKKKQHQQKFTTFPRQKTNLPLRADKKRKKKRFGVGADNREKASNITITRDDTDITKGKKEENKKKPTVAEKPTVIDITHLADDQLEDTDMAYSRRH